MPPKSAPSMKPIPELKPDDVKVLTDYVIYLSIRGELERNLLRLAEEIDFVDIRPESGAT